MKQSFMLCVKAVFKESNVTHKYTFKTMNTRDNYALLARANHQLAQDFADTREKCAHFYQKDCFECRSPHKIAG